MGNFSTTPILKYNMFNSIIQSGQTNTEELTPYNVDGLELFFTANRKVRASQSAMVRMIGHQDDVKLRRFLASLVKNGVILDVIQTQVPTAAGLRSSSLHASSTIKVVLKEFKPNLLEQFLDFGIDEGLAQMAGVPITTLIAPQIPPTRLELALMLVDAETRAEKAEKQIEADSEFTNLGKMIDNTIGCVSVGEFSKVIEIGRNTYFKELRECKIIMKNSVLPYQSMMDDGYFVVTENVGANNVAYPTASITAKGQTYLAKRHQQYLNKELVTVQMEREVNLI